MKEQNILLASTSTLFGGNYLEYLQNEIANLFNEIDEILFIPFARPSGISHDTYTQKVSEFFSKQKIKVKGLHSFENKIQAIKNAQAFFTGGGNTFLLVKELHQYQLMYELRKNIEAGKPYLGCSAGTNIAGLTMQTTNDMPIVYPSSFETMGLVPFNINPHYLDVNPNLKHNGETRETRIKEFLTQNKIPVVGLREGNWIRKKGEIITVEGSELTRIFKPNKIPYEVKPNTQLLF